MNKYSLSKSPFQVQKEIALKHRHLRKMAKLSQSELADRSGVSLGSIKRFESTGKISLESFLKLLHVLGRLEEFERLLEQEEDLKEIEKLFSDKIKRK